ncbi:MAG: hypothetical protein OXU66_13450 [Gammaproteobacteria bacterium]|nr:hypothetical protein [Gammaproteobacteria bacterium]MDD9895796.1 hypothetical protein [Gammaproteobacteria bacterium]MDD9959927.1 hypothetical protein [Gammaproteobacteria bacterium]
MRFLNLTIICLLITWPVPGANAQSSLESAEQSFRYINTTLQTFRNTGRLVNNPGIDGSDLEAFMDLLEFYFKQFSSGFNANSPMCRFYRDPENGRMTIEERAEFSFSLLRDLDERIQRYIAIDEDFQNEVADEFGTFLLDNINEIKTESVSNQQLPSSEFDEAGVISFIDSVCV